MDTPIQVDLGRIAQDLQIRRVQVESVVQLLDEGNTVPFITRYRKERTGNLNEVAIREIQLRVGRLRELAERKETILKAIEAQGKLTDELAAAIRAADNPKRLEDLYLPFKPKKKTKASEARDKGLEPLALRIWNRDETLTDLHAAAPGVRQPREGARDRREGPRRGRPHPGRDDQRAGRRPRRGPPGRLEDGQDRHDQGRDPRGRGARIPRLLQLLRADRAHPAAPRPGDQPGRQGRAAQGQARGLAARPRGARSSRSCRWRATPRPTSSARPPLDALDRLLLPSMEREVRRDLTEMAERHAVDVFARNLRSLLLQPPIPKQVVLAIDPGFRTGCKVAVLDGHGNLLDQGVIHPHPPQNRRHEAKLYLKDLVGKHQVGVVAIGNGTACRETEELIAEIIAEGTQFSQNPARPPPRPMAAAAGAEPDGPSPEPARRAPAAAASRDRPPTSPHAEPSRRAAEADPGPRRARRDRRRPQPSREPDRGAGSPSEAAPTAGASRRPSRRLPPIAGGAAERGPPTAVASRPDAEAEAPRLRALAEPDPEADVDAVAPTDHRRAGRPAPTPDAAAPDRAGAGPAAAAARRAEAAARAEADGRRRRARGGRGRSAAEAGSSRRRPSRAGRRGATRRGRPRRRAGAPRAADAADRQPAEATRRRRPHRPRTEPATARGSGKPARSEPRPPRPKPAPPPPQAAPGRRAARPARLRDRQRGRRQRLLDQPGRPRGVPRLRRHPPRHDLDRPAAPGPARRAGQDRAAEHRRRPLPARRQRQAAQGVARVGHLELRQLRRRRPEHGERPAAAARLGPEPADRAAGRRAPQGEGPVHQTASSCIEVEGVGPATFTQAAGFLKIRERREPARPDLGPPRELRGRDPAAGEAGVHPRRRPRQGAAPGAARQARTRSTCPPWRASWRSASRPCATSARPWPGPSATPATTCPSRSSRRACSSSKTSSPAWS